MRVVPKHWNRRNQTQTCSKVVQNTVATPTVCSVRWKTVHKPADRRVHDCDGALQMYSNYEGVTCGLNDHFGGKSFPLRSFWWHVCFGWTPDHFVFFDKNDRSFWWQTSKFSRAIISADHFAPIILVATKNTNSIILVDDHFGETTLYSFLAWRCGGREQKI